MGKLLIAVITRYTLWLSLVLLIFVYSIPELPAFINASDAKEHIILLTKVK
jgi:hypothetical protein